MMPYSGDRRPSPQPLQPHATLSYLSPAAAPFNVSRPREDAPDPIPNPSPYAELPTAPSLYDSWVEPPASYMDLEAASAPGFRGFATPDGFLVSENAQRDMYSGNHFGASMQPLPFIAGSSDSEWMEEKYPGIYQRTSTKALSSDFGSSAAHQPSVSSNTFACLDKNKPCSTPQPVNQYSPYSAYDSYTSHLPSSSTYPLNYDLSMPSVAASPEVCAAVKSSSPTTDGHVSENAFPAPYMNPCRLNLDYFDTMQNEQKDLLGYQTAYKHHGDWISSDYGTRTLIGSYLLSRRGAGEGYLLGESSETGRPVQPGTYPLSQHGVGENYVLNESSETGRPVQPSPEAKSGLKNLQASCSKLSPPEHSFPQPRELFIESLEVNNPVVDSPCWKGTPTAHQPSFGVVKNDEPTYPANNSLLLPKRHGTSNPENDPCVPDYLNYLSIFGLPPGCNKSEGHNHKQPSNAGDLGGMQKSDHPGYVSVDQGTRRNKHTSCKTGDDYGNMVTPGQQGSVFLVKDTNELMLGRNVGSHAVGMSEESGKKVSSNVGAAPVAQVGGLTKESLQGNTGVHEVVSAWENLYSKMPMNKGIEQFTHCNTGFEGSVKISSDKVSCRSKSQEELIKSIYNFSVMLLSTCNDGYQLEDSEHALVQSVIQNLSSLSSTISKAPSKADDVNNNWYQMKSENMKGSGNSHQPEKLAGLDGENIGADFKKVFLQDLAKLPEENVVSDNDAQMMIYKNLWIEAEASMCKLKYELQLARMKLAAKYNNQQTATAPADSSGQAKASNLPKPENSLYTGESDDSSKQQNLVKESHIYKTLLPQGGDADVFARLKVLKLRDESINCFHEANSEPQDGTSQYNMTDADDTVFDNGVDARINSLVEDIIKERTEASSSEVDEADGATAAILGDLPSCNNNTSSLEDTNIEQLESNGSNTHGAFMAKLKDLMCCSDDTSSSGEVNSCQFQTASGNGFGQFGQVEDGVMARLQVLKGRVDNTSSEELNPCQLQTATENEFNQFDQLEDGVMARLQVLKRRVDNTSSEPLNPCQLQTASGSESNQFDQLEDGVMARLQVLKRRADNTSSVEGQEVFSDHWVGHFERTQSGDGAHDELIEKTGLSDDAGFRALSDEADSKITSQYVGSLLEECHVPSAPAEPASVRLHDERLSHSPSEWENVLKEDFFLPGKPLK